MDILYKLKPSNSNSSNGNSLRSGSADVDEANQSFQQYLSNSGVGGGGYAMGAGPPGFFAGSDSYNMAYGNNSSNLYSDNLHHHQRTDSIGNQSGVSLGSVASKDVIVQDNNQFVRIP